MRWGSGQVAGIWRMVAAVGACLVVGMCWLAASAGAAMIQVDTLHHTAIFDTAGVGDFAVFVRASGPKTRPTYRITVANRGSQTARNLWVCDRIPRAMAFARASRTLRALRGMRCLVIARFLPHDSTSFDLTLRVARARHKAPINRATAPAPAPKFTG